MDLHTLAIVIVLSFISGITTLIGVYLAVHVGNSPKKICLGIGFSAGIMLVISLLELIPASIKNTGLFPSLMSTIIGGLFVGSLEFILPHIHLFHNIDRNDNRLKWSALLITFGLILHDFPEGFAMANSYLVDPSLGLLISVAIAAHNIPEEFAMAIPIVNVKSKRFIYGIAFLSGFAEPAGAILGLAASSYLIAVIPYLLSFSAGAMIFISLNELVPMVKRYEEYSMFVFVVILSLIVYLGLSLLLPE